MSRGNSLRAQMGRDQALLVLVVIVYIALFAYRSATRTHSFPDPDMMNYVDVARNIAAGRGIVQSAWGFNVPRFSTAIPLPMPLAVQPPLYPIAIALLHLAGMEAAYAALVLSALAFGVTLLGLRAFANALYGQVAGTLALMLGSVYYPFVLMASGANSEALGIAFVILSCVALLKCTLECRAGWAVAAGLAAGAAMATRYALLPCAAAGVFFLVLRAARSRLHLLTAFLAGFLPAPAFVFLRNRMVVGSFLLELNPSTVGWAVNVRRVFSMLAGHFASGSQPWAQIIWLAAVGPILMLVLVRRLGGWKNAMHMYFGGTRILPWLFVGGYLLLLVYLRSRVHFDEINVRLIAPAGVILLVPAAGCLAALMPSLVRLGVLPAVLQLLLLGCVEARRIATQPRFDAKTFVESSARLSWIARHTTARDLLLGDEMVDVVFYLKRPAVVSFSPYPYTEPMTATRIIELVRHWRDRFDRFFLVLRRAKCAGGRTSEDTYGSVVEELMRSQELEVIPIAALSDARIFQLVP